jgi:hypothetical protein
MPELPEAGEYPAELRGIMERHNKAIRDAAGADSKVEGPSELGQAKRALSSVQSELRQLKQRVIQIEKMIHADSANAMGGASGKSHAFLQIFGGRSSASRARANEKRAITRQKAALLEPYRNVKLAIDESIRQMGAARAGVQQELSTERQSAPRKARKVQGLPGQLRELAKLRESGAHTAEEYEAAKRKLLG